MCDSNIYEAASSRNLLSLSANLTKSEGAGGEATPVRRVQASIHKELKDSVINAVIALAHETAMGGYGVLIFAGSRETCETDARLISRVMPEPHEIPEELQERRLDLLNDLRSLSTGLDPILEQTVMYGVGFHREFRM